MSGKITRQAYEKLIAENIEWLKAQPRTLERERIIKVLEDSISWYYDGIGSESKIIDVFQPIHEDGTGIRSIEEYYETLEEAQKRCNGIGFSPQPVKRLGLKLNDQVFLFASSTPVMLYKTTDEMKREMALAKLTDDEKKLLGL
jgi:hypothetical protein